MTEILESNPAAASAIENKKLSRLFYVLAALQILIVFGGAVLVLLVAPASLFVSTTEGNTFKIAAEFLLR